MQDTIVGIATPPGAGGIGIVRLSGPRAIAIGKELVHPPQEQWQEGKPQPRYLHYGFVYAPEGTLIDECLCVSMPGPHSFTAEDVFEIHAHGGRVILEEIVKACLKLHARLAKPGEFTQRAFENGRIDLVQAEAIIDLIQAKTVMGRQVAVKQLTGELSEAISSLRQSLLEILIAIEASIDFPEEEVPEVERDQTKTVVEKTKENLKNILAGAEHGRILRDGLRVAIVGKPNVGKSSLLNALLREERAIVTAIPGTTRDVIEAYTDIQGVPVLLGDTAGIRETKETIELIGIERTRKAIAAAELVLFVLDGSRSLGREDFTIFELLSGKPVVVILNKVDLPLVIDKDQVIAAFGQEPLFLSLQNGSGLKEVEEAIKQHVFGIAQEPEVPLVSNLRHIEVLMRAQEALAAVERGLEAGDPLDLIAIELRHAADLFGEITGETLIEDVVQGIFARFCIGK